MFRSAIVRSLRASVPRAAVKTPAPFQIRSSLITARVPQFTPCFASQPVRLYSAPAGLSKDEVEGRIVNLLKNFDKVLQNVLAAICLKCTVICNRMLTVLRAIGYRREQGQFLTPECALRRPSAIGRELSEQPSFDFLY